MLSQRQWLRDFSTHLIERERTLESWQKLVREVIPAKRRRSFQTLIREIWQHAETLPLLDQRALPSLFRANERFARWWAKGSCPLPPLLTEGQPRPLIDTSPWALPEIPTLTDLASFLNLHPDDLGWLTNPRHHHYHEQWLPKRRGGRRLLESPKPLLKQSQRILLKGLLNKVPPHEAATGFRPGYSIRDFVHAHTGKAIVLKMDLANFFPSIQILRVKRTFMALGYRESVAYALACLTTARSRGNDFNSTEAVLYQPAHLPQGAPTSPALANLAAFRFDCRLAGLAKSAGASYTRYADDLLFSGDDDFSRQVGRFEIKVMAIALEEGLAINARKTRTMHKSQSQTAVGLILNEQMNARRADYDLLKAILNNCQKHGPQSQNRKSHPNFQAHLQGKVEWIESLNPRWGKKLQATYQTIEW